MATEREAFKFPDETQADEVLEVSVEDETVVEVVDDTPPQDRGRKPMQEPPAEVTDEELAQYSESVKKRIQHFSKGFHEERRAKEAAQREKDEALTLAQQLLEQNKKLQTTAGQNQQVLLDQAKKVVAQELVAAKQKLKEAHDAFDTDAIVAAQEALLVAKIKSERVNNFKPAPLQAPETQVQSAPAPGEAPAVKVQPKAAKWQEENAWFGKDEEMTAVALTTHRKLVKDGYDTNSDEYYDKINERMRQVYPDAFSQDTKSRRNNSAVVASVTRSTAPRKIVLSASQASIARKLGVPLAEYAKHYAAEMRKTS